MTYSLEVEKKGMRSDRGDDYNVELWFKMK
jgi:hypothetical protein